MKNHSIIAKDPGIIRFMNYFLSGVFLRKIVTEEATEGLLRVYIRLQWMMRIYNIVTSVFPSSSCLSSERQDTIMEETAL